MKKSRHEVNLGVRLQDSEDRFLQPRRSIRVWMQDHQIGTLSWILILSHQGCWIQTGLSSLGVELQGGMLNSPLTSAQLRARSSSHCDALTVYREREDDNMEQGEQQRRPE
ncbi:hypothetical protein NQZ68_016812 [Dissostichus eleginoides]|nr:hypothetical protein NQZ68_016812 [Dissostichus eleginoides]